MRAMLCVLAASPLAFALSGGFGAPSTKRKASVRPKKAPEAAAPTVPAVDKWGVAAVDEDAPRDLGGHARAVPRGEGPVALADALADDATLLAPYLDLDRDHAGLEVLQYDPLVLRVSSFLTAAECDGIVSVAGTARSREMPRAAGTFDGTESDRRTSTTFYVRYAEPEVQPLVKRAAALLGVAAQRFEEVQVARYRGGERFKWHEDAVPPPLLAKDGSDGGQRVATLLVYLSGAGNAADGGATVFRDLGDPPPLRAVPRKGDALLFFPARKDAQGAWRPDDRTVHAGDAAVREKWVVQLWAHEKVYPPTMLQDNLER
ncbi:hypothetical protein M885DRAFT_456473 [Pelagophyceae sp. CCMP2097]|nr:hypothetical protein M885DRAFT_456473 [Pelagophyceae sp. CCMP2097]